MSQPLNIIEKLRLPKPLGIIHVGANVGQEFQAYKNAQIKVCVYIEPIPEVFRQLKDKVDNSSMHFPVQALCSDVSNEEVTFNIASNHQSSSMFPMGKVAQLYPHHKYIKQIQITTTTLDEIIYSKFSAYKFDLLVMDTQGAELKILMGSHKLLKEQIKYVYSEVSESPLYMGGCTFEEVSSYLGLYKLKLKNLMFNYKNWGDALYVRDDLFEQHLLEGDNLALNKPAQQSSFSKWSKPDDPQRAVNGYKTGNYSFCTQKELNPWWQVDLKLVYKITEVRIYNRLDGNYAERSRKLMVLIGNNGIDWEKIYDHKGKPAFGCVNGQPLIVKIPSKPARYIRLQLNGVNYLHLDEVEVYGDRVLE